MGNGEAVKQISSTVGHGFKERKDPSTARTSVLWDLSPTPSSAACSTTTKKLTDDDIKEMLHRHFHSTHKKSSAHNDSSDVEVGVTIGDVTNENGGDGWGYGER